MRHSIGHRVLAAGLALATALAPVAALADRGERGESGKNNPFKSIPINGSVEDGQTFAGTFDIQRFEAVGSQLLAVGEVNGKFSDGRAINHQAAAFPVMVTGDAAAAPTGGFGGRESSLQTPLRFTPAVQQGSDRLVVVPTQATCPVLHLTLGPLDLNLLGLMVHLNQVVLNIDAQAGGGLLGNLLCSLTGLNLGALLGNLVNLTAFLNALVAALGL